MSIAQSESFTPKSLHHPAVKQITFVLMMSLLLLLVVTYWLLWSQVQYFQQHNTLLFVENVVNDLNFKIQHHHTQFKFHNFQKPDSIASYEIVIFEPSGKIIIIDDDPKNYFSGLPNWHLSQQSDTIILNTIDGIELWQQLAYDYRAYIRIKNKAIIHAFIYPKYSLPLLATALILLLLLNRLRLRVQSWQQLIHYSQNIQQQVMNKYQPFTLTKQHQTPEVAHLSQVINRIGYQMHQYFHKINALQIRQKMLIDSTPIALLLINRHGKLMYFNQQFAHLFMTPFQANKTYMLSDFVSGADKNTQQKLLKLKENHQAVHLSVNNLQHNQQFDLRLNPVFNRFGQLQGFSGCLEVVSAYHEKLQQAWINEKQQQEKIASFDKLWAVLGHELRTPLSGMIGIIELLNAEKQDLSIELQENIDTLKQSGQSMLQLLNDMLDIAKMDAGKLQLNETSTDILQLAKQTCELMLGNAKRQGIDLHIYADPFVPRHFYTDDGRLRQILLNLLSNAIKFTKQGFVALILEKVNHDHPIIQQKKPSKIAVPNWLKITVKDTGIGIESKEQKKLFSYFNQANDSISRQFGGTGLGLAISNNFSQLLGGFIHLESEKNHGSEFQVFLPLEKFGTQTMLSLRVANLPIFLIIITQFEITKNYFSKILDHLGFTAFIKVGLQDKYIDEINRLNFMNLTPIFLIDDLCYQAHENLWQNIKIFPTSGKVLVSMYPEKANDIILSRIFDGFLQKPVTLSALLTELTRIYEKSQLGQIAQSHQKANQHLSVQQAFEQFLAKRQQHGHSVSVSNDRTAPQKQKSILLAEDNVVNQKIASRHLNNLGFHVIIANHGDEAIELLDKHRENIVLILMDCHMPVMDGWETTKLIRARQDSIPIIALTANHSDADKATCLQAGMDNFLSKPLDKNQLSAMLERYMLTNH